MKTYQIFGIFVVIFLLLFPWRPLGANPATRTVTQLSSKTMRMDNRHPSPYANDVYKDNILLAISYMTGQTKPGQAVNWDAVRAPRTVRSTLPTGKTFAFHDGVLPEFKENLAGSTNAHFGGNEGFKSDGYLMGIGVCHLSSLIGWAAKDAGLNVVAPTNHDFAMIPEVPREHGVAIYSTPDNPATGATQNLYITNTSASDIAFEFTYDGTVLAIAILSQVP